MLALEPSQNACLHACRSRGATRSQPVQQNPPGQKETIVYHSAAWVGLVCLIPRGASYSTESWQAGLARRALQPEVTTPPAPRHPRGELAPAKSRLHGLMLLASALLDAPGNWG